MTLRRARTRRAAPHGGPGGPKLGATYQKFQQGFKELYNPQKENGAGSAIDVDIVFVPGLGAHPVDSWKSETGFNWATGVYDGVSKASSASISKKYGLARDFPKARILLYQYDAAWVGNLKVKSLMRDVAKSMLEGLQANREGIRDRPIVFIGHSMGGLVIAKAITLAADTYRDLFPSMFEHIAGCAFFGTPFGGAEVAAVASMLGDFGERLGYTKSSALVKMMTPGDESLNDLKDDFLRLTLKLTPAVQMVCFCENHPTDFTREKYGAAMSKIAHTAIPKKLQELVSRDSATLPGIEEMALAANHRDLVKFSDFKDSRYQLVREPLKRLIQGARLVVKTRRNSTRRIDQDIVISVMKLMNGGQVANKRMMLAPQFPPSIWIPKETEYLNWLKDVDVSEMSRFGNRGQALFIRGPEGRGKTRATMAVIQDIDDMIRIDEKQNPDRGSVLLAYFFCDPSADFSTAEDLLKSLVRQLIGQQPSLAVYAKHFVKKKGDEFPKMQANLTVENLWTTLQDMLMDQFIGRRVYFIINNLHSLPEGAASTVKLMRFLHTEMQKLGNEDATRVPVRWFITSRDVQNVEDTLKVEGIRFIDLEDDKYCDQVQLELRKTAQENVQSLGSAKKYNKALTYFASSLIGKRASNSQWIKLSCVQLAELPEAESELKIRQLLEGMPQELKALLDAAWSQIFRVNEKEADQIKELLRTLVLAFEEPTEDELVVLVGFSPTEEGKTELQELVKKCRPLLVVKRGGKSANTIGFMDRVVRDHLLEKETLKRTLGMSGDESQWQHGILALRCLAHIKEAFDFPSVVKPAEEMNSGNGSEASMARNNGKPNDDEEYKTNENDNSDSEAEQESDGNTDWDDEESAYNDEMADDEIKEAQMLTGRAQAYPVKHWLHHASKATLDIAEDLSVDDFWKKESLIRYRWLLAYMRTTKVLAGFEAKSLTPLHIAAAVGFRNLVSALIQNGHDDEINKRDKLMNTPLHCAAYFGRLNIVDELIKRGAHIDACIDIRAQTPLFMAANAGHVNIMDKLIQKGANTNAFARYVGPVINAAISSGNLDAVRLLVEQKVSMAVEDDSVDSPLALAGLHADLSMFEYLTQTYGNKLPPKEFEKAFVKAAVSGRVDVFKKLMTYPHPQESFKKALEAATEEENWDIVMILLEQRQDLNCNELFHRAATTAERQENVLEAVWKYTGGNISKETLNDSLYEATDFEKESTVQLLLKTFNIDPNATGEEYGTALTAAAYNGMLDIVNLLLDKGADINSAKGWPLQAAAAEGHYDVVKELLERGADVNSLTENKNFPQGSALQAACESGRVEIVTLLIENGANPDLGVGKNTCPIMAAAIRGERTILELLVHAKAEVNVSGGWDQSTLLINAAINLPTDALQVLLDAGADINLEDREGDTPLIVAAREGDAECVRFLLDHGADIFHTNFDNENALQSVIKYGDDDECTGILIERVSEIMSALNKAMQNGNSAISKVVRSVGTGRQGLTYDDWEDHEDKVSEGSEDEDRSPGYETPRTESVPNSARKVEDASPYAPSPLRPHSHKLSQELEAALAAQVSLLQQYGPSPPRPAKVEMSPVEMLPTTIAELPSQRRYSQQVQMEEMLSRYELDPQPGPEERFQRPPYTRASSMQWTHSSEGLVTDSMLSPGQGPVRRKPAPSYALNSSPTPSNFSGIQYQPPSQNPEVKSGFDQRASAQNSASYSGASTYSANLGLPSRYAQSRISEEQDELTPPSAPYTSLFNPSSYRPSPSNTPPQNKEPFPDLPQQMPGGWQSPPLNLHQPVLKRSSLSTGSVSPPQSQHQQEWEPSKLELKSHRTSFMGMKNTFDKARQFSTGIMNRKPSGI